MIQIDMPMPESCVECRFSQGGYMYCHAMPENFCGYVNYCEENGRPEWCPLKAQESVEANCEHQCNKCKFYEGVHNVMGHAPCSLWEISGVMWNDYCSRFNLWKESEVE